ncbi:MAG: BatA domain-containing protein [Desulfobacterales bacterium]
MSFLSPWFLVGLLGVAIPLAIHLSHKQKTEKVVFSTLRFLKRTPKKTIFFQQIQQWLLLLTRAAIVALLAAAFARPFFSETITRPAGLSPRSVVLVLDTSMSMQYGDYFDRAKQAALELLRSLHAGDEAALITFAAGTGQVRELTTDLGQLAAFVQNLKAPGFQTTAYPAALRLADQMLQSARYPDKTVVLISDYQRRAFDNVDAGWRLGAGVVFKSIKVGDRETTNLAVTEVKSPAQVFRDQEEHVILGRVRNLGTRPLSEARVSLVIDDKTVGTQNVALAGRSETIVQFRTQFRKRGVYRGALSVADDRFVPDNTFYFTVNVLTPLRVLAVIDEPAARGGAAATQWFESALGQGDRSRFQLDILRPRQVTREAMDAVDVIALFDANDLEPIQVKAVESFVKKGGSLLMAPADRVAASTFNHLWGALSPASLDQKHTDLDGNYRVIAEINQRHPIIRALQIGQNNDLGAAHFQGFWSITPVAGSEVIMRFDNGQAAFLEGRTGRGRVLLFTSSLDTAWNNFPLQGLYLPLMQETLRYLAMRNE